MKAKYSRAKQMGKNKPFFPLCTPFKKEKESMGLGIVRTVDHKW